MAKNTEKKMLSIKAKVYSFALKFYDEQLPFGIQHTVNAIQTLDKRNYQVLKPPTFALLLMVLPVHK